MDADTNKSFHDDVIAQVLKTVEDQASEGLVPSFQDMVGSRIKGYAQFTNQLIQADSPHAMEAIVDEHVQAKEMNDEIQRYLRLNERAIVDIDPAETIKFHIYHPAVQFVSKDTFGIDLDDEPDASNFYDLLDRIVLSAAVSQVLGGIKYWISPEILQPDDYALVHNLSSTIH